MRIFYLVLGNLALPFLIFYLRVAVLKIFKKEVKPLNWAMVIKLLSFGMILLGATLFYFRMQVKPEIRLHANQVTQQNLR